MLDPRVKFDGGGKRFKIYVWKMFLPKSIFFSHLWSTFLPPVPPHGIECGFPIAALMAMTLPPLGGDDYIHTGRALHQADMHAWSALQQAPVSGVLTSSLLGTPRPATCHHCVPLFLPAPSSSTYRCSSLSIVWHCSMSVVGVASSFMAVKRSWCLMQFGAAHEDHSSSLWPCSGKIDSEQRGEKIEFDQIAMNVSSFMAPKCWMVWGDHSI